MQCGMFFFLYKVDISDVPSRMCSVSVHSTHFWCPVKYYLCNQFLIHVLCCLYCCFLILRYWRQLHYLCNMEQGIPFRMNVPEASLDLHFRDAISIANSVKFPQYTFTLFGNWKALRIFSVLLISVHRGASTKIYFVSACQPFHWPLITEHS